MSSDFVFNKEYPLSDLVEFVNEKIDSTKISLDTYISTDNMITDRGGVETATKLPSATKFHHFKPTDTLFSNIRTYFRKVWFAEFEGGASPDVLVFRTKDPKVLEPAYLFYLLSDKKFSEYTVLTSKGAKMPRGDKAAIMQYKVFVPEPNVQRAVSGALRTYDLKLKTNTKINQTLEHLAQAIFKSWFVDFDPVKAKIEALAAGGSADDAELAAMSAISAKTLDELHGLKANNSEAFNKLAQTAALFPAAMQDSELGEIPEGWEVKQLSEICQVINGRAYKNTEFKTEGTPIVRIQNLSNGGKTVYSDLELPPEKYIDREDFIYAWSATFGPHIWRGPKSIYHYHIWKMEVDESVISRYFLYLSMFRKTEAMKNAGTGSIFTHLTKKIMESQHVLIGDHAINKKFSDIIVQIFDQISSLKNESTHLADIRDALLPKLLTGDGLTSEVANV
ncbi:restriction endonuclease subunit S [Vibrio mimicus]|uniref:restriction endonuclease subunit S n=1 Tax=Vibrio mimicus TaxID=674 RepID=UPI002F95ED80